MNKQVRLAGKLIFQLDHGGKFPFPVAAAAPFATFE